MSVNAGVDSTLPESLIAQAQRWAEQDVDPQTAQELRDLIARSSSDQAAMAELRSAFAGPLAFGTAGLRGALGPGPGRMNRVVVRRAAAGIARYLQAHGGQGGSLPSGDSRGGAVVIGYDARHNSDVFAADSAAILAGAGLRALMLPRPLPTPVLAYAIRALGCAAGIMVTASHNPAHDNGYKVYLADGSQITPPADAQISAAIAQVSEFPVSELPMSDEWVTLGDDIEHEYIVQVVQTILAPLEPMDPGSLAARAAVRIVHTPLHGVGGSVFESVLATAGFTPPLRVAEQFEPDPDFPTVSFPNPEEPGAMDAALALASAQHPDVVIAHDPDADRCAVAVPDRSGAWAMLTGDDVGTLLAWWLIQHAFAGHVLAQSLVSCSLLERMAVSAGLAYRRTLTGFKWIGKVEGLRFGYEEALGYCVNPTMVRDKDGIAAGLAVATIIAELKKSGRCVQDVLDDVARRHGVFRTGQASIRVADLTRIGTIMATLRADPPTAIAGTPVVRFIDLAQGWDGLPGTDGLLFDLGDDNRVIIRPSGTEPKVKCYLQAVESQGDTTLQ